MDYHEVVSELACEIEGGSAMFDLFVWLEENPTVLESVACSAFDDHYFVCESCSWTLPMSSLAYDSGRDFECEDCYEGEDE